MKISKREKILLVFMGIAVIGFLYYTLIFKHESSTINKLQAEYDSLKVQVQRGNGSESRLLKIESQLKELQSQIDVKKNKLSEPLRIPEIIDEINAMAAQKSVKIDKINFTGDASVKGIYKIPSAEGSKQVPEDSSQNGSQPAAGEQDQTQKLQVTFNINGIYGNCLNLIKAFEGDKRFYIVKNIQLLGNNGACSGTLILEMVSVSKDPSGFLYNTGGGTPRADPFK